MMYGATGISMERIDSVCDARARALTCIARLRLVRSDSNESMETGGVYPLFSIQ